MKRKRAMEQLYEIIFNATESLRNNQEQLNENTPVTMEKLKERFNYFIRQTDLPSFLNPLGGD